MTIKELQAQEEQRRAGQQSTRLVRLEQQCDALLVLQYMAVVAMTAAICVNSKKEVH